MKFTAHVRARPLVYRVAALVLLVGLLLQIVPAPDASAATTRVVVIADGSSAHAARAVHAAGGRLERRLDALDGVVARVPDARIRHLRRLEKVRAFATDRRVRLLSTDAAAPVASRSLTEVRAAVSADAVPSGGAGVDVAVVDSGVSPVPGLEGRVVDGPDLSEDAADPAKRHLDGFGHGTHLAGVIAADAGAAMRGVAPAARIVNVKVADHDGATSLAQLLAGIDWVVRNRSRSGLDIRVLNLAFGASVETGDRHGDPLAVAVERAWRAGLTVVAAGGNEGPSSGGLDTPAYDPYVIAATAADGAVIADFASRGTAERSPDVAAPGTGIVSLRVPGSLLDQAYPAARVGLDGFRGSGTSQAAAVVAGAAALVTGERPGLAPDEVKALLRATARPLPVEPAVAQGAGVIDMAGAASVAVPAGSRQHHRPSGGAGPWSARSLGLQLAVEADPWTATRWSATRWSATRWSATRWSATRWSATRWSTAGWSGGELTPE